MFYVKSTVSSLLQNKITYIYTKIAYFLLAIVSVVFIISRTIFIGGEILFAMKYYTF